MRLDHARLTVTDINGVITTLRSRKLLNAQNIDPFFEHIKLYKEKWIPVFEEAIPYLKRNVILQKQIDAVLITQAIHMWCLSADEECTCPTCTAHDSL